MALESRVGIGFKPQIFEAPNVVPVIDAAASYHPAEAAAQAASNAGNGGNYSEFGDLPKVENQPVVVKPAVDVSVLLRGTASEWNPDKV